MYVSVCNGVCLVSFKACMCVMVIFFCVPVLCVIVGQVYGAFVVWVCMLTLVKLVLWAVQSHDW